MNVFDEEGNYVGTSGASNSNSNSIRDIYKNMPSSDGGGNFRSAASYPDTAFCIKTIYFAMLIAVISAALLLFVGLLTMGANSVESLGGLVFLAVLAGLAALIAAIYELIGLHRGGNEFDGYKTAFIATVVNIAIGLLNSYVFSKESLLLSLISSVLQLLATFLVIKTTIEALETIGAKEDANYGRIIIPLYIGVTIASIVISILAKTVTGSFLAILLLIAELVLVIVEFTFFRRAYHAFN
ncbi:MAG: hypothetical protein IKX54_02515 [Lachnospiraceae bacterium]|nr:hypothetical protein [Lachnospiraceae bacterium]